MNVKLTPAQKVKLLNSDDIYAVMQRVLLRENKIGRNKEHFWIIGLAQNNRILYIELISLGTVTNTLVEPMEVFSIALQKRTVKIILIHNHPSQEMRPSEEDKDVTDRLLQVGLFLKIPVIDHLIIGEQSYYSFKENGLLDYLSESKKYVIPYRELERVKKEAEETGKQIGANERNKEVVRALKQKGVDINFITAITGLSEAEIKKIRPRRLSKEKKTP
jgi:DNA repair protein RadC